MRVLIVDHSLEDSGRCSCIVLAQLAFFQLNTSTSSESIPILEVCFSCFSFGAQRVMVSNGSLGESTTMSISGGPF